LFLFLVHSFSSVHRIPVLFQIESSKGPEDPLPHIIPPKFISKSSQNSFS
jgi:hypothetical protein